ncbi:MAG: Ig-like domain-containing protein [Phycisphaerae bacterium]|nr:Ig-like domain-containing protein [Phycisphaerae bacterium]
MNRRAVAVVWIACGLVSAKVLAASAPRVAVTVPPDGATDVEPATDRLVIRFDAEMRTDTYSLVPVEGVDLPEPAGDEPFAFTDAKTFVMRVKLAPDKAYAFGINSARRQGFKSASGEPVAPVVVRFRTGRGGSKPTQGGLGIADDDKESEQGRWVKIEKDEPRPKKDGLGIPDDAADESAAPTISQREEPVPPSDARGKSPSAPQKLPEGWVLMDDKFSGSQVAVPPGWTPRIRNSAALCIEPDEVPRAAAFFVPSLLSQQAQPDELADGFDEMLRRGMPDLSTQVKRNPSADSVERDLAASVGQVALVGSYRAVISRSGMGFVMGYLCPADRVDRLRPTFHEILASYRFTGPKMRLKPFKSAAIELRIPSGWQVQTSEANGTANHDIDWAVSCPRIPGARAFTFTPKFISSNWVTSPMNGAVDQTGLAIWRNKGYQVADFASAEQVMQTALGTLLPGLQVTRQQSLDALRNMFMQLHAQTIQRLRTANSGMDFVAIELIGRRQVEGVEMRSVLTLSLTTTVTIAGMKGRMSIWVLQVRGCEAPATQFPSLAPLLDRVTGSFTYTPWWTREVQKANAQEAEANRKLWAYINKVQGEIWDNRMRTRGAINEMMYDTLIAGNYGYVNKETGTIEKIPAEHIEGFKDEYGRVVSPEETIEKKIDPRWATRLREATVDDYMNFDRRLQVWP